MNCEPVPMQPKGVVCIYCSMRTPLPAPSLKQAPATQVADAAGRFSIVRCRWCGKEALYFAMEAIPLQSPASHGAGAQGV